MRLERTKAISFLSSSFFSFFLFFLKRKKKMSLLQVVFTVPLGGEIQPLVCVLVCSEHQQSILLEFYIIFKCALLV